MPPTTATAAGARPVAGVALRAALEDANLPALLSVLAHLTGEDRWLEEPYRPTPARGLDDHDSGGFTPELQHEIRDAAAAIIGVHAGAPLPELSPARVAQILSVSVAEPVGPEYGELLAEELGIAPRDAAVPAVPGTRDFRVAIIGGGLSGLCAAIKLEQAGVPYTLLEKNDGVGGTWLENTYPGCGVDTPSSLYSFSFAQNPDWSRYFVGRDELHRHWEDLAERSGVRAHTRYGCEVTAATFDAAAGRWTLELAGDGEATLEADVVISAVGLLNRPATPDLPGLDGFAGDVLHTAAWDPSVDLTGRRVAVIGTGASAMQLVPAIAERVAHLTVFQRSPQWAVPHPNYRRTVTDAVRTLNREVPGYAGWYRLRQFWRLADRPHVYTQIDRTWTDPERSINAASDALRRVLTRYVQAELDGRPDLLEKCLPTYPPYGKRPLIDNGWYRTMRREDVDLVTDAVAEVTPEAVVTADGTAHRADVLVLATGFKALNVLGPMTIRGRSGTAIHDTWGEDDARAHLGITIPDLPNFFCLYGPNTNTGHGGTAILSTEFQVRYVMQVIGQMLEHDLQTVEVRRDVHDAYNEELDRALEDTIWTHPGMTTYYRNSRGRIVTNSPWTYLGYWQRTRTADLQDFHTTPTRAAAPAAARS